MLEIPITPTQRLMLEQIAELGGMTLDYYVSALIEREIILMGSFLERGPYLLPGAETN